MPTTFEDQEEIIVQGNGLARGNFKRVEMISTEELSSGLKCNKVKSSWSVDSFKPSLDFVEGDYYRSLSILKAYPRDGAYEELLDIIIKKREGLDDSGTVYERLRYEYSLLSKANTVDVISWFNTLFLLGMAYRRWDGNGPYPMVHHETVIRSNDYAQEKGGEKIVGLDIIYDKMTEEAKAYISSFPSFESGYFDGVVSISRYMENVRAHVIIISKGNHCIRAASNSIIATAYVFFKWIIKDPIPKFDITAMELIG
jgi:hypothetical protein